MRLAPLLALAALLTLSGCPKKAGWVPNGSGGYTLMTQAGSVDAAMTRFRNTGDELCGPTQYALSPPVVVAQGWERYGDFGGSVVTVRADLACR